MLKSLKLTNYILVKELEIEFTSGLNIFSGETGAGKSVIIEAINTVLGGIVRNGMLFREDKPAIIEITFGIEPQNKALNALITENGIDISEGEISFSKTIKPGMKVVSYINGVRTTNNFIRLFRNILIDFHSQRDQQQLFDNLYQLDIIDAYGNLETERNEFYELYTSYGQKLREYKNLIKKEKENRDKYDLYSFQVNEIKNSAMMPDEDIKLSEELNLLTHAEELLNLEEEFRLHCYEAENSVFDVLNGYLAQLNQFSEDSSKVKAATSLIEECMANLGEAGSELEGLRAGIDLDPQRLEDVSERFDYLNSLKVKYGRSLSDLKTYCDEIEEFMDNYSSDKELLKLLEIELKENLSVLKKQAAKLTAVRKKVAREFSQTIEKDIRKLSMPAAQVEVRLNGIVSNEDVYYLQVSPHGNDYAEFYFSANKGKSMQPLKIAASGGELSRFLLAVKKIHAQHLSSRTIVFDEIDSGIGGKTAELTGEYISDIARHHQVICITHLAQIAVFAESQFNISKMVTDDISQIKVKMLDNKQKISEIARMLSGSDSLLALQHAEELIKKKNRTDNV